LKRMRHDAATFFQQRRQGRLPVFTQKRPPSAPRMSSLQRNVKLILAVSANSAESSLVFQLNGSKMLERKSSEGSTASRAGTFQLTMVDQHRGLHLCDVRRCRRRALE